MAARPAAVVDRPLGLSPPRPAGLDGFPRSLDRPRTIAWLALGGLLATIAIVAVCGGRTTILIPASVRPEPEWLAGPLSGIGGNLGLVGVVGAFSVMCACYWTLAFARRSLLSQRVIWAATLVAHLLVAAAPLLLSTDVFSYGAYGRMAAVYGLNPYLVGPHAIALDAWYPLVGARWILTPTVYGPLFTAVSYALAPLSVGAAALAYKGLAVACSLGVAFGATRLARQLGRDPARALAVLGLNPVLLLYAVGGAHNDLLMLAAIVLGALAYVSGPRTAAGGLMVLGAAIKLTGGIILPFAVLASRRSHAATRWRLIAGGLVAAVAVAAISTWLFGGAPLRLLATLQIVQSHGGAQSIPGRIGQAVGLGAPAGAAAVAIDATAAAVVLALLLAVWRGRMEWLTGVGWAIVVLLVSGTYLLPWYVVWLLPFAAVSRSRPLTVAALALTAVGLTSL